MTISPGTGGTVGGPATPTQRELEATAWAYSTSQQLGITRDSTIIPFSQVDADAVWKYKSSANHPKIPLMNLRMLLTPEKAPDQSWIDVFTALLDQLPDDVRLRLIEEGQLPPEERDQAYVALDTVLGATARSLVWLQAAAEAPVDPTGNELLSTRALQGTIALGSELLNRIEDYLTGRQNSPHFDRLVGMANQMEDALQDLDDLAHPLGSNKQSLGLLTGDLQAFQVQSRGDELQVLRSLADAMATISAGRAMHEGNPALLLGLQTAMTGIGSADSASGVFLPGLMDATGVLSDRLLAGFLPHSDAGSKMLLPLLVRGLMVATTGLASVEGSSDTMALGMQMGIGSGVLESICREVALACGASPNTAGPAADFLALTAVGMMIQMAGVKNSNAEALVENLAEHLGKWLTNVETFVSDMITRNGGDQSLNALSVFLRQQQIALSAGDFEAFVQGVEGFNAGQVPDSNVELKEQMRELQEFIRIIRRYSGHPGEDEGTPITGLMQA